MAARQAIGVYNCDILCKILRQVVVAVAILPELGGGTQRVLALCVPGTVRRSCGHSWVSVTRTDTQRRKCAGDARKTSRIRDQPAVWNRTPWLRVASLSHGAVLFWSMKPQTGTRKTHTTPFPAVEYKSDVQSCVDRPTRHPRQLHEPSRSRVPVWVGSPHSSTREITRLISYSTCRSATSSAAVSRTAYAARSSLSRGWPTLPGFTMSRPSIVASCRI